MKDIFNTIADIVKPDRNTITEKEIANQSIKEGEIMNMKRLVLCDFLSLKEGDIISLSTNGDKSIFVTVWNRKIDVPFYGNDKGKWSKENPCPKTQHNLHITEYKPNIHFKWVKENVPPFTVMEFKIPPVPKDLTKHVTGLYNYEEWINVNIDKIIKDLEYSKVI